MTRSRSVQVYKLRITEIREVKALNYQNVPRFEVRKVQAFEEDNQLYTKSCIFFQERTESYQTFQIF